MKRSSSSLLLSARVVARHREAASVAERLKSARLAILCVSLSTSSPWKASTSNRVPRFDQVRTRALIFEATSSRASSSFSSFCLVADEEAGSAILAARTEPASCLAPLWRRARLRVGERVSAKTARRQTGSSAAVVVVGLEVAGRGRE